MWKAFKMQPQLKIASKYFISERERFIYHRRIIESFITSVIQNSRMCRDVDVGTCLSVFQCALCLHQ